MAFAYEVKNVPYLTVASTVYSIPIMMLSYTIYVLACFLESIHTRTSYSIIVPYSMLEAWKARLLLSAYSLLRPLLETKDD